ncbi:MAG: substrate-binding domain-containing protein, partial [Lachnospiraceae bacterium]|nr:substrate-binding domain-containing protein [Lachnospiraceae bacterium]
SILIDPPLTSVNAHLESMGKEAVRLLEERMEAPGKLPYKVVLPLTLTERRSVADYGLNFSK